MTSTHVRFPRETMERIDAIVGQKRRAQFIRKAVNNELERTHVHLEPKDSEIDQAD